MQYKADIYRIAGCLCQASVSVKDEVILSTPMYHELDLNACTQDAVMFIKQRTTVGVNLL